MHRRRAADGYRLRVCVRGVLCVRVVVRLWLSVSLSCASAAPAAAQEAQSQATPLPPVVVETQPSAPKAKRKAKKKPSTAAVSVPAQQAAPASAALKPTGLPRTSNGTAYGPVEGYVAETSATGIKSNTPLNEVPQSISVIGTEQRRDRAPRRSRRLCATCRAWRPRASASIAGPTASSSAAASRPSSSTGCAERHPLARRLQRTMSVEERSSA